MIDIKTIADAIRKDGVPQIRGKYRMFTDLDYKELGGACAIGMAAHNLELSTGDVEDGLDFRPGDSVRKVYCPVGCSVYKEKISLSSAVIHLNDTHFWTFGQIADFLETIDA